MIYTFGDSHARIGWPHHKWLKLYEIGPILAYSFGKEKLKRLNIVNFNVKENDTVIFSFGEIDCRCHIHKHSSKESIDEDINKIIFNYFEAVKENVQQFKSLKVYILSVPPAARKEKIQDNKNFPHLGTNEERKLYVDIFNKTLSKLCLQYSFNFLNHHDNHADEEGYLNYKFSFDGVHVTDNNFFNNFLLSVSQ